MFKLPPTTWRRLSWLLSLVLLFTAFVVPLGWPAIAVLVLSLACAITENRLAVHYGEAVRPLIPPLPALSELDKGARVLLLGLAALSAFFFLPPLIRLVYPGFGGFAPDTINAYTLGAAQYFLALTMAYVSWRGLFPDLYKYAAETMEGKLLESITAELMGKLPVEYWPGRESQITVQLATLAERRKIATIQFITRCARFVFSVAPFFFFFWAANAALTGALTAVPASAPGL